MKFIATLDGQPQSVEVIGERGQYRLTIGDQIWEVDAKLTAPGLYSLLIGGLSYVADVTEREGARVVGVGGETYVIGVDEATRHIIRTRGDAAGARAGQTLKAPMPGRVTHVAVRPGDTVKAGDTLVIIEAMKMENELKAAGAGTVADVRVEAGQAVNPGDVLIVISAIANA